MARKNSAVERTTRQEGGVKIRLPKRAGVEITIHINAAERSFNGVNDAVLIAIQLLKMVMGQIECLRTRYAGGVGTRAGIIALGIFENPIVDQIRSWLYNGFGKAFL